ncbi:acyl-CoA dehydrogenase family protein [Arthrobacter sp. AZCC_0090]|uniref:acyl-CoA dehydrogenase family protein n=1 Tax=Arthrobacter sp. AZCC_0090 TaxID=2735881 RepID=UPI0037C03A74
MGRPHRLPSGHLSRPLAKAHIQTEPATLMTRRAAWLHDNGQPAGEASNVAKYAAAEAAQGALDAARSTQPRRAGPAVDSRYDE